MNGYSHTYMLLIKIVFTNNPALFHIYIFTTVSTIVKSKFSAFLNSIVCNERSQCCFQVVHHYLHSAQKGFQTRLRKRVRNGRPTYTFTGQPSNGAALSKG